MVLYLSLLNLEAAKQICQAIIAVLNYVYFLFHATKDRVGTYPIFVA